VTTFDGYLDEITIISDRERIIGGSVFISPTCRAYGMYEALLEEFLKKNIQETFMSKLSGMQLELFSSMSSRVT